MKKKQLIAENDNLKRRIRELEDILCPYNNHDFTIVNRDIVSAFDGGCDVEVYEIRTLQCKKCKKIVHDNNRLDSFKYIVKGKKESN